MKHKDIMKPGEQAEWAEIEKAFEFANAWRSRFLARLRQRAWRLNREN